MWKSMKEWWMIVCCEVGDIRVIDGGKCSVFCVWCGLFSWVGWLCKVMELVKGLKVVSEWCRCNRNSV